MANKSICKACNQEKIKMSIKVYSSGSIHWVDETGSGWYGNVCPQCRAEYKREHYASNPLSKKICKKCNQEFQPKRWNQTICKSCKDNK